MSKEHRKIVAKIQILEEAFTTLLQKASHDIIAKEERFHIETLKNMNDFVKLYRREIIHHFKVEELALFPVARAMLGIYHLLL